MLHKAKTLNGYSIHNSHDENIGKVKDTYFDDRHWTVRYLVVSTGTWLSSRQVPVLTTRKRTVQWRSSK